MGQQRSIGPAYLRDGWLPGTACWAVHAGAMMHDRDVVVCTYIRQLWLRMIPPQRTDQAECKTSRLPSSQLPLSSPRDTASLPGMFLLPIAPIAVAYRAISSVDIQHLTIPAALFTDAVDPE
jgi:hypothetical protein